MGRAKKSLYDQYRERILTDLNKGVHCISRERYVDWKNIVCVVRVTRTVTLLNGTTHTFTRTKKKFDTRLRNEQMNTLHKVMEDLVKEGILTRGRRDKFATKQILYYSRLEQDEPSND